MSKHETYTAIGKTHTVSWTETREVEIGHHACIKCGQKTPEPTTEQKLYFAKAMAERTHEYMWPSRHEGEGFKPVGWSWYESQHHTGWLCFDCTQTVNSVINTK